MAITEFGKELRKLRVDHGEVLKDMADKMGKTSAYLSAIECNKRDIPDWFIPKLIELYNLSEEQVEVFQRAKDMSIKKYTLELEDANDEQRDLALKFARSFKDMDDKSIKAFNKLFANFKNN